MMLRRAMLAGGLILVAAVVAAAAEVDGRWQGTTSGPNGDFTLTFKFKAEGPTLTGSVETPNGEQPISDGKVEGNKISFKIHFGDSAIDHQGTISGDTIQLKVTGPWGESEMTLKRVAEEKSKSGGPIPVAAAAEVDGRWEGTMSGPNGDITLTFKFKAEGTTLTGSVETPNGEQPISDGKVEGDKISFKTHFADNAIDHQGTISGDTIQLKVTGPWGELEMTLKRVAEKKSK